jgi:hypothetical protein
VDGMPLLLAPDQWAGSSSGIYFIDGEDSPATLKIFDAASRRIQRVARLRSPLWGWGSGLNVSNDGHIVLYDETDQQTGDIMLVEGFR